MSTVRPTSPCAKRDFGQEAETAVTDWLVARGAEVWGRNLHLGGGELDIVARIGSTLCFVEVRARLSRRLGDPSETVTAPKQLHLTRAAAAFLAAHPEAESLALRFDVAGVVKRDGAWEITYLPGAFEATE